MAKRLRRAGSPWRIKVHEWRGKKAPTKYGVAYHVTNDNRFGGGPVESEWSRHIELPGTEFDELVIGSWIHLEQMTDSVWWMNVAGVTVNVRVDRDGRPEAVDVHGPGDYADEEPGVAYGLAWSRDARFTGGGPR